MSDYRVDIKVRNARIYNAIIAAGHKSGYAFAKLAGISYRHLCDYLALLRSPLRDEDGLYRDDAWALCDYLGKAPSDLWSDEQLTPIKRNTASVDVDSEWMLAICNGYHSGIVSAMLGQLKPNEAKVLKLRFGLDGKCNDEHTLAEVSQVLGVTRKRVRQIEQRALYKLRRRERSKVAANDIKEHGEPKTREEQQAKWDRIENAMQAIL